MGKKRIDVLLVERGFFSSREKAQASVMAGVVVVNGHPESKSGAQYRDDEMLEITVTENVLKYVSRGGLKLEKALETWSIDLKDKVAVDIGASTGGFTDLMLQSGVKKVYAIDVGYGQLDWKLRNDPKVVNIERTNVRYLDDALIEERPNFISIDVSFISLRLVLPVAARLLAADGEIVALIKPQFEARREQVGKNGIVRDPVVHREVVENVRAYALENDLIMRDLTESPITGSKGNIEFLGRFTRDDAHRNTDIKTETDGDAAEATDE
ncbi:MAG: TlyA family RNA methyltransferase [Clostridiales Family XIII bacterium]|nr:TlyA family RNA methyltransferase [Clostridiales Family XIII bacterium]